MIKIKRDGIAYKEFYKKIRISFFISKFNLKKIDMQLQFVSNENRNNIMEFLFDSLKEIQSSGFKDIDNILNTAYLFKSSYIAKSLVYTKRHIIKYLFRGYIFNGKKILTLDLYNKIYYFLVEEYKKILAIYM
jgi:hypothetical protein